MVRKKMVVIKRAKLLPCRVRGCNFYGKPMSPKGLAGHMRRIHGLSTAHNARLPVCSILLLTDYLEKQRVEKNIPYRQPDICKLESCKKKERIYMRLDKHLLKEHNLKVHQYETNLQMLTGMEEHRSKRQCLDHKPFYPCSHAVSDFCPAQQDKLTAIKETDGTIPVDPLGDMSVAYPKLRIFKLQQVAENGIKVVKDRSTTLIKKVIKFEEGQLLWHVQKVVISKEHEEAFDNSLKPPTTTSTKAPYYLFFRYTCQLCTHWHSLRTWATPKYQVDNCKRVTRSSTRAQGKTL